MDWTWTLLPDTYFLSQTFYFLINCIQIDFTSLVLSFVKVSKQSNFYFVFQVAALGAISNIVVDFTPDKSTFIQCGGIKELVQLTKSMDSSLRLNAVWSLRNMVFLADRMCKEAIFMELTVSSVASLICGNYLHCQSISFLINWCLPK